MKNGFNLIECLIVTMVAAIVGCVLFGGVFNRSLIGNKQIVDFNQKFEKALIFTDDRKPIEVEVSKWNDYQNSDSVQIITKNGTVYYTHLSRVILMNK